MLIIGCALSPLGRVSTSDGFSYEREAIAEWIANGNKTSPLTGSPLAHAELVPNHALRAAIQEFVNANPQLAKDLYHPQKRGAAMATLAHEPSFPVADVSDAIPQGEPALPEGAPVGQGIAPSASVTPVQPPPAPPLSGLDEAERKACAALAVGDWKAYAAPQKPASSSGWFGHVFGPPRGKNTPRGTAELPDELREPTVRVRTAEGGGVELEVLVDARGRLHRLAMRLAAPGSAPLAALKIVASDGYGPGTAAAIDIEGDGFALLARALRSASSGEGGPGALASLREFSISKISMSDTAVDTLAQALAGHPSLEALELYNVGLGDAGALSVGRLARADGNPRMARLSLGRNKIHGETRDALEASIDMERVKLQLY